MTEALEEPQDEFQRELAALLNRWNMETLCDTPDFILARYLQSCLVAFSVAVNQRSGWYGRYDEPGQGLDTPVPGC